MITRKYLLYIIALLILSNCGNNQSKKSVLLPSVAGKSGDVVVVLDKTKWEKPPGTALQNILKKTYEGLPQEEPLFNSIFIPHSSFDKTFKQQRNIIIAEISSKIEEPRVLVQYDVWAKTQLIITIKASSDSAFKALVNDNEQKIISVIEDQEIKRLMGVYKENMAKGTVEFIENKHNIRLNVPKGYDIEIDTNNFTWLLLENREIYQGIFIYHYPYEDTSLFKKEQLIDKRDDMLKKHVQGEVKGSYMQTELRYPPIYSEYKLNNEKYTAELRGLWRMKDGLAMGGPFISISQLDKENNNIVTIEGFVYAPGHEKREMMRQLEAIIYSVKPLKKSD